MQSFFAALSLITRACLLTECVELSNSDTRMLSAARYRYSYRYSYGCMINLCMMVSSFRRRAVHDYDYTAVYRSFGAKAMAKASVRWLIRPLFTGLCGQSQVPNLWPGHSKFRGSGGQN